MAQKVSSKSYTRVFVSGNDSLLKRYFKDQGFNIVDDADDPFDICVFSGGSADVHPFLYGQRKIDATHVDIARDLEEVKLWKKLPSSMPKIGVCRGAQLGNVMCGGTLWQDVSGHKNGVHMVRYREPGTTIERYPTIMTLHHQMCRPTEDATILVTAKAASRFEDDVEVRNKHGDEWSDIEAFYYKQQNFLGVQWHPEYQHAHSSELFEELFYTLSFN